LQAVRGCVRESDSKWQSYTGNSSKGIKEG
jgi:hypothetical protein